MKKKITEGKAVLTITPADIPSKKQEVFYNPMMKLNRDLSILLLNTIGKKDMQIALPLAGSGIRGIRMLKELKQGIIKSIEFNDQSEEAISSIITALKTNKIPVKTRKEKVILHNKTSDDFLLGSKGFDYIDIDPFGTPNPFLDAAIKRISRDGIIAVTATDTAPLCGTYPKVCQRKYWARPMRNEQMHEIGLRILIRKVQLIGAQYEKALIPIFSYSIHHYFRIFFSCVKSKEKVDNIIKQHQYFLYCTKCMEFATNTSNSHNHCGKEMEYAGPLFTGKLTDSKLADKMLKKNTEPENSRFLKTIADESRINKVGLFNIDKIVSKHKLKKIPKKTEILKNKEIVQSHFDEGSYKGSMTTEKFIKIIR